MGIWCLKTRLRIQREHGWLSAKCNTKPHTTYTCFFPPLPFLSTQHHNMGKTRQSIQWMQETRRQERFWEKTEEYSSVWQPSCWHSAPCPPKFPCFPISLRSSHLLLHLLHYHLLNMMQRLGKQGKCSKLRMRRDAAVLSPPHHYLLIDKHPCLLSLPYQRR